MLLSNRMALFGYALFVLAVAVAAVAYVPATGEFGFNTKAATALMSGGFAAGIMIFWAWLLGRGQRWALTAAMVTALLLLGVFIWRAAVGWGAVGEGQTDKWYAASLITLMGCATASLLGHLFWHRSR